MDAESTKLDFSQAEDPAAGAVNIESPTTAVAGGAERTVTITVRGNMNIVLE